MRSLASNEPNTSGGIILLLRDAIRAIQYRDSGCPSCMSKSSGGSCWTSSPSVRAQTRHLLHNSGSRRNNITKVKKKIYRPRKQLRPGRATGVLPISGNPRRVHTHLCPFLQTRLSPLANSLSPALNVSWTKYLDLMSIKYAAPVCHVPYAISTLRQRSAIIPRSKKKNAKRRRKRTSPSRSQDKISVLAIGRFHSAKS